MKTACSTSLLLAVSLLAPAQAAVFITSESLGAGAGIGDPPTAGLARTLTISTPVIQITDLSVTLSISSTTGDTAWNGDLYAQLSGPSGTLSVLLNRSGVSTADAAGYSDTGFNVTINDGAPNGDIHLYQTVAYTLNGSGQLTGSWMSDGRQSATGSTRDRSLSQFLGQNPNGNWTLLVADLASGSQAKLDAWSISGAGITSVPETSEFTLIASATLAVFALWRREAAKPQS